MPINPLTAIGAAQPSYALPTSAAGRVSDTNAGGKSFGQFLTDALGDVNDLQNKADSMAQQFAQGAPYDVHQVTIAMEQASTSLALATQVRNKLVDAYTEIMHTQV